MCYTWSLHRSDHSHETCPTDVTLMASESPLFWADFCSYFFTKPLGNFYRVLTTCQALFKALGTEPQAVLWSFRSSWGKHQMQKKQINPEYAWGSVLRWAWWWKEDRWWQRDPNKVREDATQASGVTFQADRALLWGLSRGISVLEGQQFTEG